SVGRELGMMGGAGDAVYPAAGRFAVANGETGRQADAVRPFLLLPVVLAARRAHEEIARREDDEGEMLAADLLHEPLAAAGRVVRQRRPLDLGRLPGEAPGAQQPAAGAVYGRAGVPAIPRQQPVLHLRPASLRQFVEAV